MFVPNELPAKNVAELVELARQQPGKLNYAGYVGGVPQFLGEMLNRAAKINMVMVPYKSTTDALDDLLTNRIQVWFTPVPSGLPVQNAKQARMLAVTGDTRASLLPDIATFKEAGYPDLTVEIAYFLLAAKGTPKPIVDKLSRRHRQGAAEACNQGSPVQAGRRREARRPRRGERLPCRRNQALERDRQALCTRYRKVANGLGAHARPAERMDFRLVGLARGERGRRRRSRRRRASDRRPAPSRSGRSPCSMAATVGAKPPIAKPIWVPIAMPESRTRVGEHLAVEGGPDAVRWRCRRRRTSGRRAGRSAGTLPLAIAPR